MSAPVVPVACSSCSAGIRVEIGERSAERVIRDSSSVDQDERALGGQAAQRGGGQSWAHPTANPWFSENEP